MRIAAKDVEDLALAQRAVEYVGGLAGVILIDDTGRIKLSRKQAMAEVAEGREEA